MSRTESDGGNGVMKLKRLLFLALGHMTSDFYPGMLSPLLPLILKRYGLTMTMAGILIMVLQTFCNISQPFVGILNDNRPMKPFLWIGLIISGLPFCFLLKFNNMNVMIAALAVSGIGVGMYHPIATVAAGLNSREDRRGVSMALFSSGGSLGFMIAPLAVVLILEILGEGYMPFVIVPALVMGLYFMFDRDIAVSEKHHLTVH